MTPNSYLFAALTWSSDWWLLLLAISYAVAVASVPSVLLQRRGKPHSAVSWLLVLFALPGWGFFCGGRSDESTWSGIAAAFVKRRRERHRL